MNSAINRACLTGMMMLCVSAPLLAQSTLTPEQLTSRVESLTDLSKSSEAKLSAMQEQLKTLSEEMSRLDRLIDNRAVLEMIQQVDEISEDINLLRGEIEVQGNEIGEIKKSQRVLYQDIDRRLRDMESRSVGQAPAAQMAVPAAAAASQSTDSGASSTSQTPSVAPAIGGAAAASTSSNSPTPEEPGERAAYRAAFDTLKEGRYKEAKAEFTAFLEQYPSSSFSANAQYWLGEAHYVTRNFKQGIIEFEKVIQGFPGSNKVPDAMLKLGYTYYELKQYPQAKTVLQDLRTHFPDETASRLAAKRLDRIRKEGH
jgi:tol-pal system protein YbgF